VARLLSNENGWSRALLPWLLPGCLVSFNDYPLGDIEAGAGTTSAGGGAAGGGRGGAESASPGGGEPSDEGGASGALGAGENMIDDFQDGNQAILEQQGRKGVWYVANDGMGMQTPSADQPLVPSLLSPARGSSTRAIHTFGGPFPTWALIGTSLAMSGERGAEYDLSGFQGMRLWVRSGSMLAGSAKYVRLNLPTPGTNAGSGSCTVCNDHFGFDIPLTSQWAQVEVPFSSLAQQGYGRPALASPELEHVTSLQLGFGSNVAFDLWVDDIELY
jgi:hypothetical protein